MVEKGAGKGRRSDSERLEELQERKKAIEARMQAIRARTEQKKRKEDTRRKILLGALVLHRIENDSQRGPGILKWLREELPGFVGERDRHLFQELDVEWEIADAGEADGSGPENAA